MIADSNFRKYCEEGISWEWYASIEKQKRLPMATAFVFLGIVYLIQLSSSILNTFSFVRSPSIASFSVSRFKFSGLI